MGELPAGAGTHGKATWPTRLVVVAVVAVAVSPIVIAALSFVGDTWYPVGDLAHNYFRIGQVGTTATPLVGAESVKGWAHPGPITFWLAAPLYRLTGEDARALFWAAAIINVACVSGIAAVTWRRGRFPLLLGSMTVVAVVLHALGPMRVISIWNPFLPLLPFLLTVVLAWDVALGRRRSLAWLAVAATLASQTHLAFLTLCGLVLAWLVAWALWWRKVVPDDSVEGAGEGGGDELSGSSGGRDRPADPVPPGPPWEPWREALRRAGLVVGVLWLPVLFDALFDTQNVAKIALSIADPPATVGLIDALGIVGRYVRPDGPWMGGPEPIEVFSVQGSGPLPLVLAVALVGGCLWVGRRRGLVDLVALSTLVLALLAGSVVATGQVFLPVYTYLTQFLKLVGACVWVTVAWTAWRLVAPRLAVQASPGRRRAVGAVAGLALVAAAAWTWGDATTTPTPNPAEEVAVQDLRAQLHDVLPRDERLRVEYVGDPLNIPGPGVIFWLIHDGFEVVSSDGHHGLKWGHEHRWQPGGDYDRLVTVAAHYEGSYVDAIAECHDDGRVERIAHYDPLDPAERQWLEDLKLRRLDDPDAATPADVARTEELAEQGPMVSVFIGDTSDPCGDWSESSSG